MRAYRCDICRQVYLIPDDPDNKYMYGIPAELTIYQQNGHDESADICGNCLTKILNFVKEIAPAEESENTDVQE